MKKMPSIFARNWEDPAHPVIDQVYPHATWVFDPDVPKVATRKWDGTCVMFDGSHWWARREVKRGKQPPPNFQAIGKDHITGKVMGWEPIEQSGWQKFHAEVLASVHRSPPVGHWEEGTYELVGPAINGNPEGLSSHWLKPHAYAEVLPVPEPLTFEGIRDFLEHLPYEGIVWHELGGEKRMAKIKRKDFWPA